jgi:polysaccharide chain length determinant protein (PEP-CTERM system associated)
VRNNDNFRLSFDDESAEKAMLVTARLGTIFIDENLQIREQQASGTTSFLTAETERLRAELEAKEVDVNNFKAKYRNELPEQLDANLRTLEQLRTEQQGNLVRLAALQERRANLEKQLLEKPAVRLPELGRSRDSEASEPTPLPQQLELRKLQLEELLTRYSERHPDIIRLKTDIQTLEAEVQSREAKARAKIKDPAEIKDPAAPAPPANSIQANSIQQVVSKQIDESGVEINALRATNDLLRVQISSYQTRVDNTPIRAIELAKISRTYEITLKKYQDLLAKSFDSQLSQNMEKQHKGERFRLVDAAYLPRVPVRPNRIIIVLLGLLGGLGAGIGLAFLQENMDTSFRRGEDLDGYINAPLLAAIPAITTRGSVLEQRRSRRLLALASVGVLSVGLVAIHLFGSSLPGF